MPAESKKTTQQKTQPDNASPGQQLAKARQARKLSIKEVAQHFKLNPSYIEEIENDCYPNNQLTVYTRGYLTLYAKYLGMNAQQLIDQLLSMHFTSDYQEVEVDIVDATSVHNHFTIARDDIFKTVKITAVTVAVLGFLLFSYHKMTAIDVTDQTMGQTIDLNKINHLMSLKNKKTQTLISQTKKMVTVPVVQHPKQLIQTIEAKSDIQDDKESKDFEE